MFCVPIVCLGTAFELSKQYAGRDADPAYILPEENTVGRRAPAFAEDALLCQGFVLSNMQERLSRRPVWENLCGILTIIIEY
eukprot:747937-Amphidinium_carterae.1